MTHWGWYWKIKKKHMPRTLCSKLTTIDSFKLIKSNVSGFSIPPLDVHAQIRDDQLQVSFRNRKDNSYIIPIEKQSCNFGGFRYFFKCPLCKKRMRILYFSENSIFLCRVCLNLSYPSQCLRPTRRYQQMCEKINDKIQKEGGDLYYKRPRYMHNDNYQRLKSKQFYYESKAHQAVNQELRQWYGAKVEPYLDTYFDYVDESKEWRK